MLGLVLGLTAGVAFAYGREYLDQSIHSPEDINRLTRLPVLAVIPLYSYSGNGKQPLPAERFFITDHPKSLFSEGITSLRNYLNIKLPQEGPVSLLITSSVPREGKSLICSNLALSMAVDGKRTLLIDADLHRPTVHKIFEFDKRSGLSELIIEILKPSLSEMDLSQLNLGDLQHFIQLKQWSGTVRIFWDQLKDPLKISYQEGSAVGSNLALWRQSFPAEGVHSPREIYFELDEFEIAAVDSQELSGKRAIEFLHQFPRIWKSSYFKELLEKYLHSARSDNLFILSAGQSPSNPSEVLGSDQMRTLIDIFEEIFDRVILDCPPSWPLSDVSVLAPRVNGVLWICRSGDTPKKMFKDGVNRLREVQPNILGVVLNAVDIHRDWYYYYGYSSYYSNYRYRYYSDYLGTGPDSETKSGSA
jgi:Mrp family chromosome partitioning ATPase